MSTATRTGHCITNMQKWRAYGYEVVACRLLDGLGSNAKFKDHPVPFDYDEAQPIMLGIHETWDYGVLFPSDNTRALLEANGVVPFTEQSWEPLVEHFETFRLVGIPAELTVETTPQELSITMLFPRLIEEAQRPEGFEDTDAPMFYASLSPSNPLSGLEGLSGSPIIGLARLTGAQLPELLPRGFSKPIETGTRGERESHWAPSFLSARCPRNGLKEGP